MTRGRHDATRNPGRLKQIVRLTLFALSPVLALPGTLHVVWFGGRGRAGMPAAAP